MVETSSVSALSWNIAGSGAPATASLFSMFAPVSSDVWPDVWPDVWSDVWLVVSLSSLLLQATSMDVAITVISADLLKDIDYFLIL